MAAFDAPLWSLKLCHDLNPIDLWYPTWLGLLWIEGPSVCLLLTIDATDLECSISDGWMYTGFSRSIGPPNGVLGPACPFSFDGLRPNVICSGKEKSSSNNLLLDSNISYLRELEIWALDVTPSKLESIPFKILYAGTNLLYLLPSWYEHVGQSHHRSHPFFLFFFRTFQIFVCGDFC